jgi:hypothetical protein
LSACETKANTHSYVDVRIFVEDPVVSTAKILELRALSKGRLALRHRFRKSQNRLRRLRLEVFENVEYICLLACFLTPL